jgi:hypothetical protein
MCIQEAGSGIARVYSIKDQSGKGELRPLGGYTSRLAAAVKIS